MRLDEFLRRELPRALGHAISNSEIRRIILSGKTKVRLAKAITPDHLVRPNDKVEVRITQEQIQTVQQSEQQKKLKIRILFEDQWLIAVDKPTGIPSHPTVDRARANLFDILLSQLSARDQSSETYLAIHHRLDRDTSGIVLFVKDPKINEAVSKIFQERQISKTYVAISSLAEKKPPESWQVENYLGPTKKINGKQIYGPVRSGGQHALTVFRTLKLDEERVRIEANPVTGRTHQIRSHLLSCGFPIIGDEWYFNTKSHPTDAKRLHLHASRLRFVHPVTHEEVLIESPPPF